MAWVQTLTGQVLDFANPCISREQLFTDVAHGLATTNRYAGQLQVPLSVAQHSVLCSEAALDETGDPHLAAFCLLHDAHEAFIGDIPSPAARAIADEAAKSVMDATGNASVAKAVRIRVTVSIHSLKRRVDRAVIEAAGLSWASFTAAEERIREFDIRALRTERDVLMMRPPQPWDESIESARRLRLRRPLKCWAWPEAEERFRSALAQFLPEEAAPLAAIA